MKVCLGLSGGVDSAVAAYLLKEAGYDVTCVFMRNWDAYANQDILGNPTILDDECPQEKDYHDAVAVAKALDLPIQRVDFIKEYWDYVFSAFLQEYHAGRTPNPDILCNKYIKFDSFYHYAKKQGFDYIATGHYASVDHQPHHSYLMRAKDTNKDQTYFLCQISQEALQSTLFPLGVLEKKDVRSIASTLKLSIATKKDSTGICFIGERNFKQFLQNYLPAKEGNMIDIDSHRFLGKHEGVLYYTIGQRKGLNIGGDGPWFVVGKNIETNELYCAKGEDTSWLISHRCKVIDVNWLSDDTRETIQCTCKFRYRQQDHPVTIHILDNNVIDCYYPQGISAVTYGQEAVFYDGNVVLGGGVIDDIWQQDDNLYEKLLKQRNK